MILLHGVVLPTAGRSRGSSASKTEAVTLWAIQIRIFIIIIIIIIIVLYASIKYNEPQQLFLSFKRRVTTLSWG